MAATGGETRVSAGRTGIVGGRREAAGGAARIRATVPAGQRGPRRLVAGITTAHHGGRPVTLPTTPLVHHPTAPPKLVHHPTAPPRLVHHPAAPPRSRP